MLRDTGIVSSNYMWKEKANNYSGNAFVITNYIYMEHSHTLVPQYTALIPQIKNG